VPLLADRNAGGPPATCLYPATPPASGLPWSDAASHGCLFRRCGRARRGATAAARPLVCQRRSAAASRKGGGPSSDVRCSMSALGTSPQLIPPQSMGYTARRYVAALGHCRDHPHLPVAYGPPIFWIGTGQAAAFCPQPRKAVRPSTRRRWQQLTDGRVLLLAHPPATRRQPVEACGRPVGGLPGACSRGSKPRPPPKSAAAGSPRTKSGRVDPYSGGFRLTNRRVGWWQRRTSNTLRRRPAPRLGCELRVSCRTQGVASTFADSVRGPVTVSQNCSVAPGSGSCSGGQHTGWGTRAARMTTAPAAMARAMSPACASRAPRGLIPPLEHCPPLEWRFQE